MRRSLTKTEILRKKEDINRIFSHGRSIAVDGMRLIHLKNNLGFDRIIIIPRKHFGRAVDRNQVRRRCKEVFRLYESRRKIEDGFHADSLDYVLIVYPGKVSDFSLLESSLTKALDRANQK